MSYIIEKSLHIFGNNFKSLRFFEKYSNRFKKSSVPMIISSKILKIVQNASHY
jgi:hypothetical protein